MLIGMSNYWLTNCHCFSACFREGVLLTLLERGRSKPSLSPEGLEASKVLAHLVSLLSSSTQAERDHQERGRVHSCHGVKACTAAFHPVSDLKGDSVSKTLILRHRKVTFGTFKKCICCENDAGAIQLLTLERTWKKGRKGEDNEFII